MRGRGPSCSPRNRRGERGRTLRSGDPWGADPMRTDGGCGRTGCGPGGRGCGQWRLRHQCTGSTPTAARAAPRPHRCRVPTGAAPTGCRSCIRAPLGAFRVGRGARRAGAGGRACGGRGPWSGGPRPESGWDGAAPTRHHPSRTGAARRTARNPVRPTVVQADGRGRVAEVAPAPRARGRDDDADQQRCAGRGAHAERRSGDDAPRRGMDREATRLLKGIGTRRCAAAGPR